MDGPFFFPGIHVLIALAFVVFWIVVLAGILWALYFVIRTAVTRGILRADALRSQAGHAHPLADRPAPPAQTHPDEPRAEPTPPDVAA